MAAIGLRQPVMKEPLEVHWGGGAPANRSRAHGSQRNAPATVGKCAGCRCSRRACSRPPPASIRRPPRDTERCSRPGAVPNDVGVPWQRRSPGLELNHLGSEINARRSAWWQRLPAPTLRMVVFPEASSQRRRRLWFWLRRLSSSSNRGGAPGAGESLGPAGSACRRRPCGDHRSRQVRPGERPTDQRSDIGHSS